MPDTQLSGRRFDVQRPVERFAQLHVMRLSQTHRGETLAPGNVFTAARGGLPRA